MGDNGTGKGQAPLSTIGGRALSGMKGSMLECGGLVPTIANWPGKVPSGKVSADLIDSTDWLPTFAELIGGKMPEKTIFDGHSIAPQLRGEAGTKREWIYNQLAAMWYVREAGWKLNEKGELFDMSGAPFTEKLVAATADTDASKAARTRLTAVLARLNPAGGIPDTGDGTGRHASKAEKKKKKGDEKSATAPESKPATVSPSGAPAPADAASAERAAKFDHIDRDKHGKLTREEYTSRQSDAESASKRFDKFDTDKDGFVTREEYIKNGAKKLKSK
jgi:arylsulfatase A